jgi:nucleoside-diphosphate-sugar epimerase
LGASISLHETFFENSLKGIPTKMNSGADHPVNQTYIDDFLQGALWALDEKNLESRISNITGGKVHTFKEMARMAGEIIPVPRGSRALACEIF